MVTQSRGHLLSLPPELRIQIYEYVMSEPVHVAADQPIPPDPSILRTCRLIRREALDVYCASEYLTLEVRDCDVTKAAKWLASARHHRECEYGWYLTGQPNWTNILIWLVSYPENKCPGNACRRIGASGIVRSTVFPLRCCP